MTLLIDIGPLSGRQSDEALEVIYKSIHDHGNDDSIWNPHESPYIRRLIELFTERGLVRLDKVRTELDAWAAGERHRKGNHSVIRPDGMMRRWDKNELALVKLYLETLPPDQFTLDDWGMVVDYLVQRYLPEDELRTEAEWLTTRAGLMGRVQANMEKPPTLKQADTLLAAMPNTLKDATKKFSLSSSQHAVMDFGRARAAEAVARLSDNVRHKMRDVIMQHEEQKMLNGGASAPGSSLRTRLLDEFGTLNRDWRRIALTEAGEMANQGFIASQAPGNKVKRLEQYAGACPFCRKIDGVVMEVVPAGNPDKNSETQIWVGKTNIGRSVSPRKRIAGGLVERSPDERWQIAAGVQHPFCRGQWLKTVESRPDDDPEFSEWLKNTLGGK